MNTDFAFGIIIGFLFVCLVVLFCAVIIKLYIQKIKKYNAVLYEKEIAFQKTLNSTILETQEHILNSISQDLHDDAGQQLTVINFQLENFKLDWPAAAEELNSVSESVAHLSDTLRKVSHSLNHHWLSQNGLLHALEQEIVRLQKNKFIHIEYTTEPGPKSFKPEEQIVLFRIIQECLNNTLKHARASLVKISVHQKPHFCISIEDNGVGFELEPAKQKGIGLINCQNRASIIDYDLRIESRQNQGTRIILTEKNKSS